MRVAVELTVLELDQAGTARTTADLLAEMRDHAEVDLLTVAHPGEVPSGPIGRIARGLSRELIYFPWQLPHWVAKNRPDVLHCPVPLAPRRSAAQVVVTVHDAIAWDHPEWLSKVNQRHMRALMPRVVRGGAHLITPSEYSKERIAEALDLDRDRITVVPWGISDRFSPGVPTGDPVPGLERDAPFVLTVGTLQPRKNIESALRAFEQVAEAGAQHHFVVVGGRGWFDEQLVSLLNNSDLGDRIHVTGYVSDAQLIDLYRTAACFVFPSRYEGFGLPPLEAMACGAPVISSNRTSLPEVVGDAGILVDPDDRDAITDALEQVLGSAKFREELAAKGIERAGQFSWRTAAQRTIDVYRGIAGS